jgi:glucokinase
MSANADILVADIGGTNARFAIARREAGSYTLSAIARLTAAQWPSLDDAVAHYLSGVEQAPTRAAFAVAGPVKDGFADLTNSPWVVDAKALAQRFGLTSVKVVNDFAGQARGALLTPPHDVQTIAPGAGDDSAPIAVLGPGTGLGLAYVHPSNPKDGSPNPKIIPTEGGHTAFAPITEGERRIAALLGAQHGYVSFERVCSGIGICAVYAALRAAAGHAEEPLSAAEISARATDDPLAAQTMATFFAALGVFAGNAVLMGGARGGVYLGGGILPKLSDALLASDFLNRFSDRGPMSGYLADVPIRLICSPDAALYGAAALGDED